MTRVSNLFVLFSSVKLSIVSLAAAHHNCVGLTQGVRRLSVVSTNMGEGAFIFTFSHRPATFLGGAKSLQRTPVHVVFFRVSVGALDVRVGGKPAFSAFPFDPGNCGLLFFLACRSLCEVGVA